MIELPHDIKIYMAVQPINMRKSFDGLAVIVQEVLKQNPLSSHLFVFRNKPADKIKLLVWDRNGFVIYYKRLEKGRFKFPKPSQYHADAPGVGIAVGWRRHYQIKAVARIALSGGFIKILLICNVSWIHYTLAHASHGDHG